MKNEAKDPLSLLRDRWGVYYAGLDEARRRNLWIGVALTCLLAGLLMLAAGRTHWSVLYTGLEARDAGAITEKLKTAKVPYKLAKDGTEIQVPDSAVYEQRLALASQGLPQGQGRGYELLDENNLLLSEESARVNRMRALQGELERSILSIKGVEGVRVHLVVPERRLFSKDEQPSSASILLKLEPGAQIGDTEASAIAHLVSHAVEGLKPEAIAIVDTEGHDIGPGASGSSAQVGSRIEATRKVERHLHDQVQSMFDEALGPDQAIVRVHAELDFDDQTVSKEIFEEPTKKGGLVREQSTDSSSEGAGTSGGAVATNGAGPVVGQQNRNSTHSSSKVTYELNRTVQNITQSAGNLKRVSVSVLLKQSFAPAELATLQQAVQQAVGIDPVRGDLLSVAVLPAKALTSAQASMAEQVKSLSTEGKDQRQIMLASAVAPWVVTALVALLLAGLAWAFLRPPKAPKPAPVPLQPAVPAAPQAPTSIPMETDLQQLVERYPSSAAQVLRRMMTN